MKKIATMVTMVSMMALTSASAGEWGKGPSYNGRNYDPNYNRPRGHRNAPGIQNRPQVVVRPGTVYCFAGCGTMSLRNGTVVYDAPDNHRIRTLSTDYRTFFGRPPVFRGIGTVGIIGTYQWFKGEIQQRDHYRQHGQTFYHYE